MLDNRYENAGYSLIIRGMDDALERYSKCLVYRFTGC